MRGQPALTSASRSPLHWTIGPRTCCKDGPVLPFSQVDVFTSELTLGNPVDVVHVGDGSSPMRMAAFARWTNLSETTFLLTPTDPAADYRFRIFTPVDELPFAGHPPSAPRGPGLSRAASRDQTGTSCSSAARVWFASLRPPADSPLPRLPWSGATVSTRARSGLLRTLAGWTLMTSWTRSGPTTGQGGSRCCSPTPRPCSPSNRPELPSASSPGSASSAPTGLGPMPPSRSEDSPRRTGSGEIR